MSDLTQGDDRSSWAFICLVLCCLTFCFGFEISKTQKDLEWRATIADEPEVIAAIRSSVLADRELQEQLRFDRKVRGSNASTD